MPGYTTLQQLLDLTQEALTVLDNAVRNGTAETEMAAGHNCASVLRQFANFEQTRPNIPPSGYTRSQVENTMRDAALMIRRHVFPYESSVSVAVSSLIDLLIAATTTRLNEPRASLEEIIENNWTVADQECSECGGAAVVGSDGPHHLSDSDLYDTAADDDHTAVPEPDNAVTMVLGWLEDLR